MRIIKAQYKLNLQLQLHKLFNMSYTPLNKLGLLSRTGQVLNFRAFSRIDFVQINYVEYQVLPHAQAIFYIMPA